MPRLTRVGWIGVLLLLITACGDATVTTQTNATTAPAATTGAATTSAATTAAAATSPAATTAAATTMAGTSAATTGAATTAVGTTVATTAPAASGTPTLAAGQFENPVINQDFADPGAFKVGNTYYAYATNTANVNIQEAKSTDLVHWQMLGEALPTLPSWASKGNTWAPDVAATADGKGYVMYFVARDTASNKQCIGVATSKTPEGPFASTAAKPFICQLDQGGSIDPTAFTDSDKSRYVLWKNDGNCCGLDTYLYIQKVSGDGLTLSGQPTKLIHEDQTWEGNLVEAPTMWKHGSKYYLFYSANNYAGADYAIGYAEANTLLGPYHKPSSGPFAKTVPSTNGEEPVIGPGGEDIVVGPDGQTWMLYHSWDPTIAYRQMNVDKLTWNGDTPVLNGPKTVPEAVP